MLLWSLIPAISGLVLAGLSEWHEKLGVWGTGGRPFVIFLFIGVLCIFIPALLDERR